MEQAPRPPLVAQVVDASGRGRPIGGRCLVADRRRLPGLSAQLRRQRRRRRRRPARHHRPSRPPGRRRARLARRRRDLAVAHLPVTRATTSATTSPTTPASIRSSAARADFDRLVDEAHRRDLKVILDLVLNHSSDLHPWFTASRADRTGPYADWYIWRDPPGRTRTGAPRRPNNWLSFFGGPAWTWDETRGAVVPPHLPAPAARPQLAGSGRPGGLPRRHPDVARSGRRWPPLRRLQRLLQAPRPAVQPAPSGRRHAVRPAAPPVRQEPPRAGRPAGRDPGHRRRASRPDDGRRAVRRAGRAGRRRTSRPATSSSTGRSSRPPGTRPRSAAPSPPGRPASGRSAGRRSCSPTTTARATPAATTTGA